jgi:hypothetical protein
MVFSSPNICGDKFDFILLVFSSWIGIKMQQTEPIRFQVWQFRLQKDMADRTTFLLAKKTAHVS